MVSEAIRSSDGSCSILVKRRRIGAKSLFTTQVFSRSAVPYYFSVSKNSEN